MAKLVETVAAILRELRAIQGRPAREILDSSERWFPTLLPTGDGGSFLISDEADRLLAAAARMLSERDSSIATRYSNAEWGTQVRKAFGPALAAVDLEAPFEESAEAVLGQVKRRLAGELDRLDRSEHGFGCTLFSNETLPPFSIGPASFEPREAWLSRKVGEGDISSVTARRLVKHWSGRKPRPRKPGEEQRRENAILKAIADGPYVCSVQAVGLAPGAARDKALRAARLAMTSIALIWALPSSALSGFNLRADPEPWRQGLLSFGSGGALTSASRLVGLPHGPDIAADEWETLLEDYRPVFAPCGEILEFVLSARGTVERRDLISALAHSLLWFNEGCRETLPLKAVVNFAASMECLAPGNGGGADRILALFEARAGYPPGARFRTDGATLRSKIKRIYGDGRSRTMHGTNDQFGHDWSTTRTEAELLARRLIVSCLGHAGEHPELKTVAELRA